MPEEDSVSRQALRKDLATKDFIIRIANAENQTYDRNYLTKLIDKVRYPEWDNPNHQWTYLISSDIRDVWHHMDDLAKLAIYSMTIKEEDVM